MTKATTLTSKDREMLLYLARRFYGKWPEHRAAAVRRDIPPILARWRESATPKRRTLVQDFNDVDLVLFLYTQGAISSELDHAIDWYGLGYLVSVLVLGMEERPVTTLIRANAYMTNEVIELSNEHWREVKALRAQIERRTTRAKNPEAAKNRGQGKTREARKRDAKITATALDIIQTFPRRANPDFVTEQVAARFKGQHGFPQSKATYRRKLTGLFGSPRPRKRSVKSA